jgi:hypothetical protein
MFDLAGVRCAAQLVPVEALDFQTGFDKCALMLEADAAEQTVSRAIQHKAAVQKTVASTSAKFRSTKY